MKILVMGSGGVGGYFGARLQQAGHDVTFVARGRHLEALRRNGLKLRSAAGDAQLAVKALEQPADAGAPEVVLLAVKLWDTESAAQQLAATRGYVIPFQNGVESVERIGRILGPERVLGGAAYIAARIGNPGEIVHTGTMARLRFGPVLPMQRPIAEQFLHACRDAKVEAELSDDIVRALWEKFVLLVAVSASTTVTRRSLGVALAEDLVARTLAAVDGLPHEMKASMLGDLEAGGRLEAPWLSGAVVRMAREAGLEAPVNRAVLAALKPFIDGTARQAS
jgi:2-dehydropantoate 2-reductase